MSCVKLYIACCHKTNEGKPFLNLIGIIEQDGAALLILHTSSKANKPKG